MNGLEIGMVVLVVVVLLLVSIILIIYFRGKKAKTTAENEIIMLMEPRAVHNSHSGRISPYTGQPLTPKRLRQKGQANALSSFKMELSDQQKLDALLKMREVCENVNETEQDFSEASDSDNFIQASTVYSNSRFRFCDSLIDKLEEIPGAFEAVKDLDQETAAPVERSRRNKGITMFGDLDDDEEDELLLELDEAVPSPSNSKFMAQPLLGVDRDAQHTSEKMFDKGHLMAIETNTVTGSSWSVTSPVISPMKRGTQSANDDFDLNWQEGFDETDSDQSRSPTPTTIL